MGLFTSGSNQQEQSRYRRRLLLVVLCVLAFIVYDVTKKSPCTPQGYWHDCGAVS